jgi:transporter family-2 protein
MGYRRGSLQRRMAARAIELRLAVGSLRERTQTPGAPMLILVLIAFVIGMMLPLQAGINAQLRNGLGHPLLAAFASFAVGTVALLLVTIAARARLSASPLSDIPWWQWTGGLLGAIYIVAAVVLAPRMGAAALIAAIVAGQMTTSLVLDTRGWGGFAQQPLTPARLFGGVLVIAGVLLITRR